MAGSLLANVHILTKLFEILAGHKGIKKNWRPGLHIKQVRLSDCSSPGPSAMHSWYAYHVGATFADLGLESRCRRLQEHHYIKVWLPRAKHPTWNQLAKLVMFGRCAPFPFHGYVPSAVGPRSSHTCQGDLLNKGQACLQRPTYSRESCSCRKAFASTGNHKKVLIDSASWLVVWLHKPCKPVGHHLAQRTSRSSLRSTCALARVIESNILGASFLSDLQHKN